MTKTKEEVEDTLTSLEDDKLLGISIKEILEGIESDDEETKTLAQSRIAFLQKQVNITDFARSLPSQEEEALKALKEVVSGNTAIVNPSLVLEKGIVVATDGSPEINKEEQLQQVGIDLRLAKAAKVVGNATLSNNKANTIKPQFVEMQASEGYFLFKAGELYSLDFMEDVKVPENMAAIIKHRSTINRTIGTIESGWFDPGFISAGGCGAVFRPNTDVKIEIGFRCAQIVFYTASSANLYNGQYQNS